MNETKTVKACPRNGSIIPPPGDGEPGTAASLLAYAAFRMGQTFLCANALSITPAERAMLLRAFISYRQAVAHLLNKTYE